MIKEFTSLYYEDAYCQENQAEIISIEKHKDTIAVELTQSCFYPEGGGQPGDRGFIRVEGSNRKIEVKDCILKNHRVLHVLENEEKLQVGQKVSACIDWARRFELMQQHSSEHIFSGLANRTYGLHNVGFHINDEYMTFDFDGFLDQKQLLELEEKVNHIIYQNLPIEIKIYSASETENLDFRSKKAIPEDLRLVIIEEVDSCACCGTQVKRTGEIGCFIIIDSLRYKGGVRITALAGSRALRYLRAIRTEIKKSSQLLSSKETELSEAVEVQVKKLKDSEAKAAQMSRIYFAKLIEETVPDGMNTYRYFIGFSTAQLKNYVKSMAEKNRGVHYALLATPDPKRLQYFICSKSDLDRDLELLNVALNGKGGGRSGFAQGTINVDYPTARSYFDSICHAMDSLIL